MRETQPWLSILDRLNKRLNLELATLRHIKFLKKQVKQGMESKEIITELDKILQRYI